MDSELQSVSPDPALHATVCAICGTTANSEEVYPSNFDDDAFTPQVFSARRLPDGVHYRMVRCRTCGLIRSDPVAASGVLNKLYEQSTFTYDRETGPLTRTYGRYLRRAAEGLASRTAILEIGSGNGFLLEEALRQGWTTIAGVEPSSDAIANAAPEVRPHLVADVMREGLFPADTFDLICLFQVLDHIPEPVAILEECRRVLKPGGRILCLNHNVEALSAKILGERSPIIDVEHTYLYSPRTMRKLFERAGLQTHEVGRVFNTYPLRYLFRLVPMPTVIKKFLLRFLDLTGLGRISMSVPLGNLFAVAEKRS